jgi:gamma-glutamylcyclotransferase (GGCT)/AIG2-like uncharacterized protein YtfP
METAEKTCLLICPIGVEGSDVRELSDELLGEVFRPTAEACGYTLERADEIAVPGQISQQILDRLVHADLVIADLTHLNPNVFYELAVRHATGKPVVQLLGGDTKLPFDIQDYRTIHFPLVGNSLSAATANKVRADLTAQIQSLETADVLPPNPISAFLSEGALGGAYGETLEFFPTPQGSKYNEDFYSCFTEKIRGATNSIYITGEGFECADEQGKALARRFHEAFREALRGGVNVVRIQTKEPASMEWANMLSELAEEFPETFQLVTLARHGTAQMSSVCVIDPEDDARCVVEIMLQTEKLFGIRAADLAGTAVFIKGRPDLARDMRSRIVQLCESEQYHYYFAYGSNMAEEQMRHRCPSAEKIGVASLRDHELVFNRRGSYRPGGVASVAEADGKRVYGVVWRISSTDLEQLDVTEDPGAYKRSMETVFGLEGSRWRTYLYEAMPEGVFDPDRGYLDMIIEAAVEAGLPQEYVEELQAEAA